MNLLYAIADAVSWELGDAHIDLPAAIAAFAKAAAPVAVAAIWQGAVVAIGMALLLRLARRVSAAHRFTAWAVGFTAVAALPLLPLFSTVASSATPISATPFAGAGPWFELDSRWALMIAAFWFAGAIFRLAELAFHSMRLRKLWKSATPIEVSDLGATLSAALPLGSSVQICTTRELNRPSVIGFFAPRILLPEWLVGRLTPQELQQVVLHEAEHLRRRDDWTNLLQKFFLVLFPLNPALAWMERRLCREREMACDEGVVLKTQAPRAYAACLTSLAERGLQRDLERRAEALSLAAWRRRPELVHRVHSILRRKQALHPAASRAFLAVLGCGLLLGSVEMARCPQMVAFVVAPKPMTVAKLERGQLPIVDMTQGERGLHAVETKAILPSGALAPLSVGDEARYGGIRRPEPVSKNEAATGPRERLIKAVMPPAAASEQDSDQDAAPEYIVLTAWERVETAPHRSRAVADYDTSQSDGPQASRTSDQNSSKAGNPNQDSNQAGSHNQNSSQANNTLSADSPTQFRVTRLILRVYPAGPPAGSLASFRDSSKASPVNDSKSNQSKSHQPAAAPLDGGWLFFQL